MVDVNVDVDADADVRQEKKDYIPNRQEDGPEMTVGNSRNQKRPETF